jgi:hypothetical protein
VGCGVDVAVGVERVGSNVGIIVPVKAVVVPVVVVVVIVPLGC